MSEQQDDKKPAMVGKFTQAQVDEFKAKYPGRVALLTAQTGHQILARTFSGPDYKKYMSMDTSNPSIAQEKPFIVVLELCLACDPEFPSTEVMLDMHPGLSDAFSMQLLKLSGFGGAATGKIL